MTRAHAHIGLTAATVVTLGSVAACSAPKAEPADTVTYEAAYVAYSSADDLFAAADLVVEGRVTGSEVRTIDISIDGPTGDVVGNPHEGAEQAAEKTPFLYTVYDVVVSRALSGTASPGDVIEVKQPGGTVDGTTAALSGGVLIDVGRAYTLFLDTYDDPAQPASLLNQEQAVYAEKSDGSWQPLGPSSTVTDDVARRLSSAD